MTPTQARMAHDIGDVCDRLWAKSFGPAQDDDCDPEVCANCGAYFDNRFNPTKWQRCAKCRAGLENTDDPR